VVQLWQAKQKRQIIFVSHNAILVANGCGIGCMARVQKVWRSISGNDAGEGTINVPDVRDAIKRIMEGGKAAPLICAAKIRILGELRA
jgi:chromosome segregation protein